MTALLPLVAASSLLAQARAQADRVAAATDGRVLRAHMTYLSDDLLEGRAPATRGGLLAAKYIAAQFAALGLEPAGDSGTYFHHIPVVTHTPSPTFAETAPKAAPLAYKTDYIAWAMRNDTLVHAASDLVYVGYGITAPEWKWDDYAGVDVRGKIVVTLVNDPGLHDPAIFKGKVMTYYGRWTYKIEEAARHGAAGILMIHTPESATYGWSTVVGSWTGQQVRLEEQPTSLVFAGWLSHDGAARLFADGGHPLDSLMEAAGHRGFRAVPLGVSLDATVRSVIHRSETFNVVGRWPGHGPLAKEAVLIGGHYDHLGIGPVVNGDSIYNGAEDNASGSAGVVAAATAFSRSGVHPERSIVFIAFGAEESGLLGSEAFAARPTVPLRDLAAVLNVDGLNMYGKTRDIAALGTDMSTLGKVFTEAAAAEQMQVVTNEDALLKGFVFRSDHFPFMKAGVPALSLQSGTDYIGRPASWGKLQQAKYNDERYHQPSDEMLPWFTMDGAVQQLRVVVRTAVAVADAPHQPTWLPRSEFRAAGEARVR
ncbi:MAG TPA: M20/M25/M40 family metallo-hydrolase [Gemmatimonadales bacterium]|nr:M20/M25/M40 family metallo-hydrolase [Gemmatimonadales bacterium]